MGSRYLRRLITTIFGKNTAAVPDANLASKDSIAIYGVNWCPDCRQSKVIFQEESVPYVWIDIDKNKQGENFVLAANSGNRSVPTITFPDGTILVEPGSARLRQSLQAYKASSTT